MMVDWKFLVERLRSESYDVIIDYDESLSEDDDDNSNYVTCPHCLEPLYEVDFPLVEMNEDGEFECPICEELI